MTSVSFLSRLFQEEDAGSLGISINFFRERVVRIIILTFLLATSFSLVSMLFPHQYPVDWNLTYLSVLLAGSSVALIYFFRWHRFRRWLMHLFFGLGIMEVSVFIFATGGIGSPFGILFLLVVILGAIYHAALEDLFLLLSMIFLALASPLLYTRPFPWDYLWHGLISPFIYYSLAGIIALMVMKEMLRLLEILEQDKRRLSVSREAGKLLTSQLEYKKAAQTIVDQANQMLSAQFTFLAVPNSTGEFEPIAVSGSDQGYAAKVKINGNPQSLYSQEPVGRSVREKVPVAIGDILTDPAFAPWRHELYQRGIQSVLSAPVLVEGEAKGAILSYSKEKKFFSAQKISLLSSLADYAGIAIVNARLYKKSHSLSNKLILLQNNSARINSALTLEEICGEISRAATEIFDTPKVVLRLYDPERNTLFSKFFMGLPEAYRKMDLQLPLGMGSCGLAGSEKRMIFIENVAIDPLYKGFEHYFRLGEYRAERCIPLLDSKKELLGTLSIFFDAPFLSISEEDQLAELFAMEAAISLEKTMVYQEAGKARSRYNTLFAHACDAIIIHNLEGRILEANQHAYRWLGYSREEYLKLNMRDLLDPERVQGVALEKRWLEARQNDGILFESRHRKKDGAYMPVEVSMRIIRLQEQEVVQVFIRDITEKKRAENELKNAHEELVRAEKLAAVGETVVTLTHHLANAVTPIKGFSHLLLKKFSREDVEFGWIQTIRQKADEIASVVENMQRIERYETTLLGGVKILNVHRIGKDPSASDTGKENADHE